MPPISKFRKFVCPGCGADVMEIGPELDPREICVLCLWTPGRLDAPEPRPIHAPAPIPNGAPS